MCIRDRERIGRLLQMHANQREEIKEVMAGDIAAAVGLKEATTGETLCDPSAPITLEKMEFPEPVISEAVEPKTKQEYVYKRQRSHRVAKHSLPRKKNCCARFSVRKLPM